jgi:DHA1 family inner membrane transport protein
LGQATNWRVPFVAVAVLGAIAALWIAVVAQAPPSASIQDEPAETPPVNLPALGIAFLVTALGFGSMFVVFTFISTYLVDVTGLEEGAVPALLLAYGAATAAGTLIGGQIGDRWPNASLPIVLALLAAVLAVFAAGGSTPWSAVVLLVLWGLTGFALPPLLQARVIEVAGAGSTLASTLNVASFNVGIAAGSVVGTALVDADHLSWTPAVAAIGTAIAVPLAIKWRRQNADSANREPAVARS